MVLRGRFDSAVPATEVGEPVAESRAPGSADSRVLWTAIGLAVVGLPLMLAFDTGLGLGVGVVSDAGGCGGSPAWRWCRRRSPRGEVAAGRSALRGGAVKPVSSASVSACRLVGLDCAPRSALNINNEGLRPSRIAGSASLDCLPRAAGRAVFAHRNLDGDAERPRSRIVRPERTFRPHKATLITLTVTDLALCARNVHSGRARSVNYYSYVPGVSRERYSSSRHRHVAASARRRRSGPASTPPPRPAPRGTSG